MHPLRRIDEAYLEHSATIALTFRNNEHLAAYDRQAAGMYS